MTEAQDFTLIIVRELINAVIAPVIATVTVMLYLKVRAFLDAKLSDVQEEALRRMASFVVEAAEQAGLTGLINNIGAEKKAYAMRLLQSLLHQRGLGLLADNVEVLSAQLEAAVLRELNRDRHINDQLIKDEIARIDAAQNSITKPMPAITPEILINGKVH
jgi:hypothetical protein